MIDLSLMRQSLHIPFGEVLSSDPGFAEGAANLLQRYAFCRDYAELSRQMEDYLFNALYERLGPGMALPSKNGISRRFFVSDLPEAADAALFPLFFSLPPNAENYAVLHDFWLSSASFSAMRTLYLRYTRYLPYSEKIYIEHIVSENVPPHLLDEWLNPSISPNTSP